MWRQGYIHRDREFSRRVDAESFIPGVAAALQADMMLRHAEGPGEESNQMGIGFSLYGRCRYAHLETAPVGSREFISSSAGLDAQVQQQILSFPTVPGLTPSHLKGLPVMT